MLNVIIIENKKPANESFSQILSQTFPSILIKARLHTVKESINWFSENSNADMIFCEIQLLDGMSFDIFERTGVTLPVIFITCHDKYLIRAFETNGIDYLLEPVNKDAIEKFIIKYNDLKSHFTNNRVSMLLHNLEEFLNKRKKTKLVVKSGSANISLLPEDVAFLYRVDKTVFVVDRFSKKYFSDKTLTELEDELDSNTFFRVNRHYILNIGFIKSFKPYQEMSLVIETPIADKNHRIIITRESAAKFRKWMQDA